MKAIFNKPEELLEKVEQYFETTLTDEITITGLCLFLGIHKDTLYEYNKRDGFSDIVKMARLRVENAYEISLRKNGRTGDIFALKNFGWTDKQEIEHSGELGVSIIDDIK